MRSFFTGKNIKNPIHILLGFPLEISRFSSKIQVWRNCNFPKFGLSRNIQFGLTQIPNLAQIFIQDWKNRKIAISRKGLMKHPTLGNNLSRTGYFNFPVLANRKSTQGLILSPCLENDISSLGFHEISLFGK